MEIKCVTKKNKDKILAFWHHFEMAVTCLYAPFWYLCVHSVEDSTLSIFDQFRFSVVFMGLPNSALITILMTPAGASLLILGYDATASSKLEISVEEDKRLTKNTVEDSSFSKGNSLWLHEWQVRTDLHCKCLQLYISTWYPVLNLLSNITYQTAICIAFTNSLHRVILVYLFYIIHCVPKRWH